jgi:probable rRNA maturation factor
MSVDVRNESGAPVDEYALVQLARHVLDRMGIHPQAELSIMLITVDAMSALRETRLGEPGPTDVLAFEQDYADGPRDDAEPVPGLLGDVVLCPGYAATQAVKHHRTLEQEIDLLLTHGILHLLGYDHAEPEEQKEMFALQDQLLAEWHRPPPRPRLVPPATADDR